MNDLTRAERISEYNDLLDAEIELLRTARETEQDLNEWLRLDNDIDALLIHKDNAAAEIDAALLPQSSEVDPRTDARFAFEERCMKFNWQWFYSDSGRPFAQVELLKDAKAGGFVEIYEQYRRNAQNPYCPAPITGGV
jgi:hypothetical protein